MLQPMDDNAVVGTHKTCYGKTLAEALKPPQASFKGCTRRTEGNKMETAETRTHGLCLRLESGKDLSNCD